MGNTVSLCMIVKNEINNIGALMSQVLLDVEEVNVVDTGSTDGTLELLQNLSIDYPNLKVHQFTWIEDFSAARNFSFSKATQEWIMWLDGDDSIDPIGLREFKNKHLDNPSVDCWLLDYIYSRFPDGKPQHILGRERFLRRSRNPRFIGAIHECVDIANMRQQHYHELKIVHNRDGKILDLGRNLRILASEYQKRPNDTRTAYYYGKELFDNIDDKAQQVLESYLLLPGRYYDDEVNARFRLAKIYLHKKMHRNALRQAEEIYHIDDSRERAEGYFIYGEVEKDLRHFKVAIEWYKRCLVPPPPPPRVMALEYYGWHPKKKIAECYGELQNYDQMFVYARQVKELLPTDASILTWFQSLKQLKLSPKGGLVVVEFGSKAVRDDSYLYDLNTVSDLPFADASLDGMVLSAIPDRAYFEEYARVIKPGGFLWTIGHIDGDGRPDFGCISIATFRGQTYHNYIRVREDLPTLAFETGDLDFGPYRIRLDNLRKSAVKSGYQIAKINQMADIYVSQRLPERPKEKGAKCTWVLDVCEKLDGYDFANPQNADIINCSSDLLKQHLQKKFPGKSVIAIDDHFEMTPEEWL